MMDSQKSSPIAYKYLEIGCFQMLYKVMLESVDLHINFLRDIKMFSNWLYMVSHLLLIDWMVF